MGEVIYLAVQFPLRMAEPFRKRRELFPNKDDVEPVDIIAGHCLECTHETVHEVFRWRLDNAITWQCTECFTEVEK